jgi:hypothetical protein
MKQISLLVLTVAFACIHVNAQSDKGKLDMVFDNTVNGVTSHDFGSIIYGANGKVTFTYANKGTKPLVISDVKSSCGCTIPTWTKDPVEPGKIGTIDIQYDTKLPGVFNKTVVVYSNANNSPIRIEIRGKVNSQPSDIKNANGQNSSVAGTQGQAQDGLAVQASGDATGANADPLAVKKARSQAAEAARLDAEKKQKTAGTTSPAKTSTATPVKKAASTTTKK